MICVKKEPGVSVLSFITVILTVVTVTILYVAFMGYFKNADVKNDIDVVAREYILRMETVGYLTDDMKSSLKDDLAELGVTDVAFTGSTIQEVGYGEQIVLCISGKVRLRSYSLSTLFGFNEEYEWKDFSLTPKSSTAKY